MRKAFIVLLLAGVVFSCKNGKELKTNEGFRYVLYTENKGEHAKVGDYLTIVMLYKNEEDSVLFDSRINGQPIRFRLEKIPFKGSYEDGLTYMAENDSATFFVPADSLYNYLYRSRHADMIKQEETALIPHSFLRFDIKLLKIQTETQAEEEMLIKLSAKEKAEKEELNKYLAKNNISVQPDTSGYYMVINENGSGPVVENGKLITVSYEGRFLNDTVFDGTSKAGHPYRFIAGAHHVIQGWEYALKNLKQGDKITLVLPSSLAYGENGLLNPKTGNYFVPPHTPVVFDIEILKVEDAPAVSRNSH